MTTAGGLSPNRSVPRLSSHIAIRVPAEFVGGVMPAVEQKYWTYAEKTDKAGFEASRKHRAFGGFSMGSVTTWFEFAQALDYVAHFMPISSDCWQFGTQGGQRRPEETAAFLGNIACTGTHGTDFYVYAATGSDDFAYPWLSPQIAALKNEKCFTFGLNVREGNITFHVLDGGRHYYEYYRNYIISGLTRFFVD